MRQLNPRALMNGSSELESRRDEAMKLLGLAPWQIDAMTKGEPNRGDGLFADLLPSVVIHRRAQARIEQRIALLRCIETIRMHAADHDGKPPEKLDALAVPLPVDPFMGKPFGYRVEGAIVKLSGTGKQYEIRLK